MRTTRVRPSNDDFEDELRALAGHREEGPNVSLFMPTMRVGAEIHQGPIRFKNLISEVESQLKRATDEKT